MFSSIQKPIFYLFWFSFISCTGILEFAVYTACTPINKPLPKYFDAIVMMIGYFLFLSFFFGVCASMCAFLWGVCICVWVRAHSYKCMGATGHPQASFL